MSGTADRYLGELYESSVPSLGFKAGTKDEWAVWRDELKKTIIADLGGFPTEKCALNPNIIEETDCGGYIRQRVSYSTDTELVVLAYVLIPKNKPGRIPAVIACHGHGYGSREIVGLDPDGAVRSGDPGYQKDFAVELARRGFLVIAPEAIGFGDRRLAEDAGKPMKQNACHRISTNLLMMGKTIAGARVWDIIRTVDYLQARDDVDPERIGCMGISGGGMVCAYTAAIEERIKAAIVSGYVNTYKDTVMSISHCICNIIPGLLRHAEMPDVVGMTAPRPLLMECGSQDDIFPIEGAREAFIKLGRIYGLLGAGEKLGIDIFEGKHRISGVKAYDWLAEWL